MAIEVTPEPYVDVWFTFGVQYGADERWNRIVHPVWPPADGDGWLRVRADDYDTARAKGWEITGGRFALCDVVHNILNLSILFDIDQ
mgnify:CR=1 FL=1